MILIGSFCFSGIAIRAYIGKRKPRALIICILKKDTYNWSHIFSFKPY